jgi:hypothetical protein
LLPPDSTGSIRERLSAARPGKPPSCGRDEEDQVSKAAPPAHRSATELRSQQEIRDDLEVSRNRLASTIDALTYRISPKTIVKRKLEDIRAEFVDADGALRKERVAIVAGAAIGVLALVAAGRMARRG